MLHTMINNPRPTRAEVTDIANAVYSSTDALMLSGETASGKYPIEAVRTMAAIAEQAELDRMQHTLVAPLAPNCDIRDFMAHAAIEATEKLGVKGIITDSTTGITARALAAFRGPHPVLAICYTDKLQRLLNLSYGVIPVYQKDHIDSERLFLAAVRMLRQKGYVALDDKIAYLSGNVGAGGATKFLEINMVKEVFDQSYQFHLPKI
jgi:pyruvate kinase